MTVAALVLAGRRASGDAVADSSGLRHRALVEIAGVPMLERVVDAILASGVADSIAISSDDPDLPSSTSRLAALSAASPPVLRHHRCGVSPASSVADFFASLPAQSSLLVTTADHPLLTGQIVAAFVEAASASSADFVVGLVASAVYRRRFPDQPRTFIPLRGEKYSGANLFLLRTPRAQDVALFWRRAEEFRKTPWKLVRAFGPMSLVLFLLGRLDLRQALARASAVIGANVDAVELPFAEAALDVDKEADRVAVEAVFAARKQTVA